MDTRPVSRVLYLIAQAVIISLGYRLRGTANGPTRDFNRFGKRFPAGSGRVESGRFLPKARPLFDLPPRRDCRFSLRQGPVRSTPALVSVALIRTGTSTSPNGLRDSEIPNPKHQILNNHQNQRILMS